MILSIILYALAIGVCVGLAAIAAERAVAALRFPRRFVWLTAIVLSALWPVAALLRSPASTVTVGELPLEGPIAAAMQTVSSLPSRGLAAVGAERLDTLLLILWGTASLTLAIRFFVDRIRIRRARKGWTRMQLDGTTVSVTDDHGPALIAHGGMEIVIPSYALMFEPSLRALILKHENEHLRARDPALLFVARLAMILMPWNVAIFWQANRLRLALEIDCDARVLAKNPDTDRYARLLLAIAQLRSTTPLRAMVALAEGPSQLERRIRTMKSVPVRRRWLVAAGAFLFSATAIAIAGAVESPQRQQAPQNFGAFYYHEVEKQARIAAGNAQPVYPASLRAAATEGTVLVAVVVDEKGAALMESLRVIRASDSAFTRAVRAVLPSYKFIPAELNNSPVRSWVQIPFTFSIGGVTSQKAAQPATISAVYPADRRTGEAFFTSFVVDGPFFPNQEFSMGGVQQGEMLRGYDEFTITPTGYVKWEQE